jgi:hypothetical protein
VTVEQAETQLRFVVPIEEEEEEEEYNIVVCWYDKISVNVATYVIL